MTTDSSGLGIILTFIGLALILAGGALGGGHSLTYSKRFVYLGSRGAQLARDQFRATMRNSGPSSVLIVTGLAFLIIGLILL